MKKLCECKGCDNDCCSRSKNRNVEGCGGLYGLGFLGAAFFFIGHATSFWMGVVGFFQALVWPAFLVYELFKFLIK